MNTTTTATFEGAKFERIHIHTHLISLKEDFDKIIQKYVLPEFKKGDVMAISEKVVSICQGKVVHISVVKPGLLARLLVKGVRKYEHDIGFSHPAKMQVAIWQVGELRMILAMIGGSITRLFGRHGDFWRIAGNHISEIDGFNPKAIPPFDEFAMLPPNEPDKFCNDIEAKYGIPTIIIDGNNINTEILGMSDSIKDKKELYRGILLDNPMGQGAELTPIILIR